MKKTLAAGLLAASMLAGASSAWAQTAPAPASTSSSTDWCEQLLTQAGTPRDVPGAQLAGATQPTNPDGTPPTSDEISNTLDRTNPPPGGTGSGSGGTGSGSSGSSGGSNSSRYVTNPDVRRAFIRREGDVTYYVGQNTPGFSSQNLAEVKSYPAPTGGIVRRVGGQAVQVRSASVNLGGLHPTMINIIDELHLTARALSLPAPVITSAADGRHSSGSLHGSGKAMDIRCNHIPKNSCIAWVMTLKQALGRGYDVMFEDWNGPNSHIHIEYDGRS